MELYVGGCCQGKLDYVLTCRETVCSGTPVIADGAAVSLEEPERADILNHFHLLVKRLAAGDRDVSAYTEKILAANPQIILICDEVGMGIVPVDAFERRYREEVGRCCCMLAKKAGRVERIVCGRGMRIQ